MLGPVGSSSPTRDPTQAPRTGTVEAKPLDRQGCSPPMLYSHSHCLSQNRIITNKFINSIMHVSVCYINSFTHAIRILQLFSSSILIFLELIFWNLFLYVISFAIWRTICSNAINLDNDLNYFCFEVPHLLEIKIPRISVPGWGFLCSFID